MDGPVNPDTLTPGKMRECVELWRLVKTGQPGGGFTRETNQVHSRLRVALEINAPVNRITGEVLSQSMGAQMGVRASVEVKAEDLIVRRSKGEVWRVIGPVRMANKRWQVVALELRDGHEIPE